MIGSSFHPSVDYLVSVCQPCVFSFVTFCSQTQRGHVCSEWRVQSLQVFGIPPKATNFKMPEVLFIWFALITCFDHTWALENSEMWCRCHAGASSSQLNYCVLLHLFLCVKPSKVEGNFILATVRLGPNQCLWPDKCVHVFFLSLKFAARRMLNLSSCSESSDARCWCSRQWTRGSVGTRSSLQPFMHQTAAGLEALTHLAIIIWPLSNRRNYKDIDIYWKLQAFSHYKLKQCLRRALVADVGEYGDTILILKASYKNIQKKHLCFVVFGKFWVRYDSHVGDDIMWVAWVTPPSSPRDHQSPTRVHTHTETLSFRNCPGTRVRFRAQKRGDWVFFVKPLHRVLFLLTWQRPRPGAASLHDLTYYMLWIAARTSLEHVAQLADRNLL